MDSKWKSGILVFPAALALSVVLLGCEKRAETPGEKLDNAIEKTGEAVDDAADATEEAVEDAADAVDDAADGG